MKINEILTERKYDPSSEKKLTKAQVAHKEFMASLPKYATWISSNAKYFDHEAKDQAMAMRQSGRTPEEIYAKTGMYYGEDGAWMSRISDKDMKIKKGLKPGTYRMGDVITHDEFFKNYPAAADLEYQVRDNRDKPELGGVAALDGTYIGMSTHMRDKKGNVVPVDAETLKAKTGHELQHIIQTMEPGMSKGGAPGQLTKAITKNIRKNSSPVSKTSSGTYLDKDGKEVKLPIMNLTRKTVGKDKYGDGIPVDDFQTYKSIWGEIVGRNTDKTINWSQKKMDKNFPVLGPNTPIVTVPRKVDKRTVPNSGEFKLGNDRIDPVVTKVTPDINGPSRNNTTYTTYMNKDFRKNENK
jgi:hypothetical protein